jgi:hypothetical protein
MLATGSQASGTPEIAEFVFFCSGWHNIRVGRLAADRASPMRGSLGRSGRLKGQLACGKLLGTHFLRAGGRRAVLCRRAATENFGPAPTQVVAGRLADFFSGFRAGRAGQIVQTRPQAPRAGSPTDCHRWRAASVTCSDGTSVGHLNSTSPKRGCAPRRRSPLLAASRVASIIQQTGH